MSSEQENILDEIDLEDDIEEKEGDKKQEKNENKNKKIEKQKRERNTEDPEENESKGKNIDPIRYKPIAKPKLSESVGTKISNERKEFLGDYVQYSDNYETIGELIRDFIIELQQEKGEKVKEIRKEMEKIKQNTKIE